MLLVLHEPIIMCSLTGMTIFWGPFLQPFIPFAPKVTMAMGKPIDFPNGYVKGGKVTETMIEMYHAAYLSDMQILFERYKEVAGHGSSVLEIK